MSTVLQVDNLHVRFRVPDGLVHAVNGAAFQVKAGEWLGIVGESGSGKSVSLLSILGLLHEDGYVEQGTAHFFDRNLLALREAEMRKLRGRDIGIVFQSASNGLNPLMGVGVQVMEPLLFQLHWSERQAREKALALLAEMGIPDPASTFRRYVFQLSGGMRQRAMIAAALACEPRLLIADEPTTALDTTVQMQVLSVLQEACTRRGLAVVMVTHDMGVAAAVCDRVVVMYGGRVVEEAVIEEFLRHPAHPYTLALRRSTLSPRHRGRPLTPIPGAAAPLRQAPVGCVFQQRCHFATDICRVETPLVRAVAEGHTAACHHMEEVARHVG